MFFNFLMRAYAEEPEIRGRRILHMIDTSLKFMGRGGIHDHVAQVTQNVQDTQDLNTCSTYWNWPVMIGFETILCCLGALI